MSTRRISRQMCISTGVIGNINMNGVELVYPYMALYVMTGAADAGMTAS